MEPQWAWGSFLFMVAIIVIGFGGSWIGQRLKFERDRREWAEHWLRVYRSKFGSLSGDD